MIYINNRGMATITVLVTLPILIAILSVAVAVFYLLNVHNHNLHVCRMHLLETETNRLKGVEHLLALNPLARALRLERKAADAALASAYFAGPPAVAIAQAKLAQVVARQNAFSLVQRSLIMATNLKTTSSMYDLRRHLQGETTTRARVLNESFGLKRPFLSRAVFSGISVRPVQKNSPTPDYKAYELAKRHLIRVQWTFRPHDLLPTWLDVIGANNLTLKAQCATTAEQGADQKWRPRLEKDKL